MKLLLDENLPIRLVLDLPNCDVQSVKSLSWKGLSNGRLLMAMQDHGIEFLITMDRSMRYQIPIDRYDVKIILLIAPNNKLKVLRLLMKKVVQYLNSGDHVKLKEIR